MRIVLRQQFQKQTTVGHVTQNDMPHFSFYGFYG